MYRNWDYLFKDYLAKTKEELFDAAQYHYRNLCVLLDQDFDKEESEKVSHAIICNFIFADSDVKEEETTLYNYVLSKEENLESLSVITKKVLAEFDKDKIVELASNFDENKIESLIGLGLSIFAIDGEISIEERQFINNLIK